jgi:hypothetical protein
MDHAVSRRTTTIILALSMSGGSVIHATQRFTPPCGAIIQGFAMLPIEEISHKHLEGFTLTVDEITALVRDWRKRGEALEAARPAVVICLARLPGFTTILEQVDAAITPPRPHQASDAPSASPAAGS